MLQPEPLHAIKEAQQMLEESQRFARSHSGNGNRPDTPEFFLLDTGEIVAGDSDDNPEQEQIKAAMEAQIADFDDE